MLNNIWKIIVESEREVIVGTVPGVELNQIDKFAQIFDNENEIIIQQTSVPNFWLI